MKTLNRREGLRNIRSEQKIIMLQKKNIYGLYIKKRKSGKGMHIKDLVDSTI